MKKMTKRLMNLVLLAVITIVQRDHVYAVETINSVPSQLISDSSTHQLDLLDNASNQVELEYEVIADHNNFIQPEGITNISSEINFKKKSKNVSYSVDISHLQNERINGEKLMVYELNKAMVQIIDLNSFVVLNQDMDYSIQFIAENEIMIRFNHTFIEEGAKYKISIYIPTTMGSTVVYGGENESTYLNQYVNQTDTIKAILKASPKMDEMLLEAGQMIEVYRHIPILLENNILLKYLEIAKIN